MRYAVLLLLVACHDAPVAADAPADAAECAFVGFDFIEGGCVEGGLAGISLDGTWTLTGTRQDFDQAPVAYSSSASMQQTGTGACAFTLTLAPFAPMVSYIDETRASYTHSITYPHVGGNAWEICVRATDGVLAFRQHITYSIPAQDETIIGVFTR